jgi:hypothetical protein
MTLEVSMTLATNLPPYGINNTGGNLPPVSMTSAANFATGTTGVDNTGGKFALVSTVPVAN